MGSERTASWWHREGERLLCDLCPHRCSLPAGATGLCGARAEQDGKLIATSYGVVCVQSLDPIEKKPIFHYRPGTLVYSLGTYGCNLDCANCQNFELVKASRQPLPSGVMSPQDVVTEAERIGAQGIAWTFNEPVTWYEFVLDTARAAEAKGLYTMVNTNGYILPAPAEELFGHVQVVNIDVKGFTEKFYRTICGAGLQDVLNTCILAKDRGVHVELTYLLIPGLNDSAEEIGQFTRWVVEHMGADTPIFFFRFQPFYRLSHIPEQSMEKMNEARTIAQREGARYVYFGGVAEDSNQNTLCPRCSAVVVERRIVRASGKVCFKEREVSRFCPTVSDVHIHLKDGRCPRCGEIIPIVL